MKLQELTLRKVRLPLTRPYELSYRTFTEFEPIIVEARDTDGRRGWGEGHVSPGSSGETRDGAWIFCREHAAAVVGLETRAAKAVIAANIAASRVAATALLTAIEMLEEHSLLQVEREIRLPLLTPFNSTAPQQIEEEVERRLAEGFRTFKIKVGKDAQRDLERVQTDSAGGRRSSHAADRCQPRFRRSQCQTVCRSSRSIWHRAFRTAVPRRGLGRQCQCRGGVYRPGHAGRADLDGG